MTTDGRVRYSDLLHYLSLQFKPFQRHFIYIPMLVSWHVAKAHEAPMARILLIDDERDLLTLVAEVLAHEGHQVTTLTSGFSFLNFVSTNAIASRFDLVITDLMLPDVSGLDIIRALKAAHPSVLSIAMSGGMRGRDDDWQSAARDAGAITTLAKPFRISDLRLTVVQTLNAMT